MRNAGWDMPYSGRENSTPAVNEYRNCKALCIYKRGIKKKRAGAWNVPTGDNIVACVTECGSDKSAKVHCPPLEGHGCKSRDSKLAEACINCPTRSPSIQSRPLSLRLCHFWSTKKGKRFHLERRHQAVFAELIHNATPGILREPFTTLCRSGSSASTARANICDMQVLVSVPRPPARFFLNALYIIYLLYVLYIIDWYLAMWSCDFVALIKIWLIS